MEGSRRTLATTRLAWIICLVLLLLVVAPTLYLWRVPTGGSGRGGLVEPALVLPTLLLNLLFMLAIAGLARRLWVALLIASPLLLWLPAELFYLSRFGGPTTAQTFGVIVETDPAEALAWLGRTGVLMLAGIAGWGVALFAAIIFLRRTGLAWRHWSARVFGLVIPLLVTSACLWGGERLAASEIRFDQDDRFWREVLNENRAGWTETLAMSYPLGLFVRAHDYWRQSQVLAEVARRQSSEPFGVDALPAPDRREIFVFIVGESLRSDHLQINGYARQTTPRLMRRNLISFRDFVSVAPSTRASVPTYFTRQTAERLEPVPTRATLLDGMREAGFRTYWFSTQAPFGRFDSPISVIARRADKVDFVNPGDYRQRGIYDMQLLVPLAKALEKHEPRVFIVLHALGSHADYRYRYPAQQAAFGPVLDEGRMADPWDRRQRAEQVNAYDNSVLYTDQFVDSVLQAVERQDARSWVFYVADHGETLFDGQCAQSGHGFPSEPNYRAAAFFWASPAYTAKYAGKLAQLRAHARAPADYRAIMPTMLDMAGVRSARLREGESLASAQYAAGERWVASGGARGAIDFDQDVKGRDCANGHE